MSLLTRLLGPRQDDHAAIRPLWHRVVALARERAWYAPGGIADSVAGRFDAITLVLALVLLRLEAPAVGGSDLALPSVRLTELFVTDMDGQLRESGVGDLMVGKKIGRLMSVLGGRLGAYRAALVMRDEAMLIAAIGRNVALNPGAEAAAVARMARDLANRLAALTDEAVLAGDIA